jgi:hypothetical protein
MHASGRGKNGLRLDMYPGRISREAVSMEQRLRLVQGGYVKSDKRQSERLAIEVPGQIVWKDAKGTTRMASVITRNVSEQGVRVECLSGTPIPQYRLVYFQVDRDARHRPDLPAALRKSSVLSAVFRVGECQQTTGAPRDYALRLLVEPDRKVAAAPARPVHIPNTLEAGRSLTA